MGDNAERKDFALKLLPYLPDWAFDEDDYMESAWGLRLIHKKVVGARMWIGSAGNGRVEISGGYPHGHEPHSCENPPRISVSMTRPAAAVAADIARRFIPRYLELYAERQERAYHWGLCQAQAKDLAEEFAQLPGAHLSSNSGEQFEVYVQHGHFRISPGSDGPYVSLERTYSLPPEMALQVARIFSGVGE
ncbi:MAG: hypothetical protein JXA21_11265 [Anaerolineae bacterium]|nr:hypothetical protein [Anaerolineae bacterium]